MSVILRPRVVSLLLLQWCSCTQSPWSSLGGLHLTLGSEGFSGADSDSDGMHNSHNSRNSWRNKKRGCWAIVQTCSFLPVKGQLLHTTSSNWTQSSFMTPKIGKLEILHPQTDPCFVQNGAFQLFGACAPQSKLENVACGPRFPPGKIFISFHLHFCIEWGWHIHHRLSVTPWKWIFCSVIVPIAPSRMVWRVMVP